MHLSRAAVTQHFYDLAAGRASHDRIVDDDDALARDIRAQGVHLHADAVLAHMLVGLDERPAHIAVFGERSTQGMPDTSEYPRAATSPESGTPLTMSASMCGLERARMRPASLRA